MGPHAGWGPGAGLGSQSVHPGRGMVGSTPAGGPGGETETSFEIKNMGVKSPVRPRLPTPCPASSQAGLAAAPRPSQSLNFGLSQLDSFAATSQIFVIRDSCRPVPSCQRTLPPTGKIPAVDGTGPARQFPERPRWPNRPAQGCRAAGKREAHALASPQRPLQTSRAGNTEARRSS